MKKTRNFLIFAGVLAFAAVLLGLCLFFFATTPVKDMPQSVEVQEVDGEFYAVTTYSSENTYCFKIEQQLEGDFYEVQEVKTDVNTVKLSDCKISIAAGEVYRFSACYVNETVLGEYCSPIVWQATWTLSTVSAESAQTSTTTEGEDVLSWQEISGAQTYTIKAVDQSGNEHTFTTSEAKFSLSENLSYGRYRIFIMANSTNQYLSSSDFSEGIVVEVYQQNKISSAVRSDNTLTIGCSIRVSAFEVYVDGSYKGQVQTSNFTMRGGVYYYTLDASVLLFDVESSQKIEVGSATSGYLLASELFEVV